MKPALREKINKNELLLKFALVLCIFCSTFLAFKALQKTAIYNATLQKVTHTYNRDLVLKNVVWKVDEPYYYIDSKNSCRWDAASYFSIKEHYYNADERTYGFFPLFPLLWKISSINVKYIGLFNYLLFGFSVILISVLFFEKKHISSLERLCVFAVSLTLAPMVVYYMPYAEAVFIFTFALAMYGLIKNKYWLFFISILLFAMTRPAFGIVSFSFVIMDFLFFLKHKDLKHFLKELSLKLAPLILGTLLVFMMFYLNSGSFMKYFESINKYWDSKFSIPDKIIDWSVEAYGMNLFTIFFIIIPSAFLFINYFLNNLRSDESKVVCSIFNGDSNFIKSYFFNNAILYFWGVFLYVLFFQAGALNGISRYVIASPFFFIFLFHFYSRLKEIKLKKTMLISVFMLILSFLLLTGHRELEPALNFNDSGYFTLLLTFIYILSLRFINDTLKIASLAVLTIYNSLWITYLYNIYLCDGWIFT